MLNWDEPLTPAVPRTPEAVIEASVPQVQSSAQPVPAAVMRQAPAVSEPVPAPIVAPPVVAPPSSTKPINPDDKRVVNGQTDINQLAPFKYPWAWDYFLNANKNHWTPLDINMTQDVHDFQHKLTLEERHVYENVLSYLTTSDILAMRNIGLAVMEKMTAPELQIYQARQVYEEAMHTWTYQHCIESLGLDQR